ncbi:MAG: hypothetical protein E7372_01310 [Clostridiales bacterium]|nr:hypothetical protein [Clostridiales bacterium]
MEEKQEIQQENSMLRNILFTLKRNLLLMLVIVIVTTSLGLGYSYIKKPKYTASIRVNFSIDGNTTATINEMRLYIDTIVDFCGQGVVVDRANAYYIEWIENYQQDYYAQNKTIEDFYDEYSMPKKQGVENDIFKNYKRPTNNDAGTLKDENFLVAGAISTQTAKSEEDATNWVYGVQYTDANQLDAVEKVYILVLAYKHELYWDTDLGNKGVEQYFTGLYVDIDCLGMDGVVSDVSKTKITLLAGILGVVLALLVVYVKTLFDGTLKDKEELERITGTQVIGSINYVRESDKNGK